MKKVYKAHILFTKERTGFEVLENGYVAVEDGCVVGVSTSLSSLDCDEQTVTDFGDCLLIPAMNDMHVHAPQYRNQGIAMDLELLPWLQNYTFPEEKKYADAAYAERMYRRFIRDMWRFGTMRSCVFATIHTASTRLLMNLFREAGMGAMVGKVAMNRNCPPELIESVEDMVAGNEALIAEFPQYSPLTSHLWFVPSSPRASYPRVPPRCCRPVAIWPPSISCPYSLISPRTWPRYNGFTPSSARAPAMAMPITVMASSVRRLPSWPIAYGPLARSWS